MPSDTSFDSEALNRLMAILVARNPANLNPVFTANESTAVHRESSESARSEGSQETTSDSEPEENIAREYQSSQSPINNQIFGFRHVNVPITIRSLCTIAILSILIYFNLPTNQKPHGTFCDSKSDNKSDGTNCTPCPLNAFCFNNNVQCKNHRSWIDGECAFHQQQKHQINRLMNRIRFHAEILLSKKSGHSDCGLLGKFIDLFIRRRKKKIFLSEKSLKKQLQNEINIDFDAHLFQTAFQAFKQSITGKRLHGSTWIPSWLTRMWSSKVKYDRKKKSFFIRRARDSTICRVYSWMTDQKQMFLVALVFMFGVLGIRWRKIVVIKMRERRRTGIQQEEEFEMTDEEQHEIWMEEIITEMEKDVDEWWDGWDDEDL